MLRDRSKQMSVLSTENLKRGMKTSLNNFGSKLNATSQTKELTSVHQSLDFKKQEGTGMQNIEKYIGMKIPMLEDAHALLDGEFVQPPRLPRKPRVHAVPFLGRCDNPPNQRINDCKLCIIY